jgi:TatD DNase family protein
MFVYDSHCHLEHINTLSHHLIPAIVLGVTLEDAVALFQLRKKYPVYKIGFGLHPWFIGSYCGDMDGTLGPKLLYEHLTGLILSYSPDFVGEVGLDKYRPDFPRQLLIFEAQVVIAKQFNLPLIIHCVKAYNEVLSILKAHKVNKGLIHGFNANSLVARGFYEQGFLLGIGSHITTNSTVTQAITEIPLSHIVLESDAPYMPAFAKENSSSNDCFLYAQMLSHQLNINLIDVINQSNLNVRQLFP